MALWYRHWLRPDWPTLPKEEWNQQTPVEGNYMNETGSWAVTCWVRIHFLPAALNSMCIIKEYLFNNLDGIKEYLFNKLDGILLAPVNTKGTQSPCSDCLCSNVGDRKKESQRTNVCREKEHDLKIKAGASDSNNTGWSHKVQGKTHFPLRSWNTDAPRPVSSL